MSRPAAAPRFEPPPPWPRRLVGVAAGAALLGCVGMLGHAYVQAAPPVPFSDESAHMMKVVELWRTVAGAPFRTLAAAALAPMDSYPLFFHGTAVPVQAWVPGPAGVRTTALAWLLLHALVAVLVGPRLWGWRGTAAYLGLACAGPLLLSLSTLALLDGPSAAAAGVTVLCLLASRGFRRPGPAMAFAVAAAVALYTKWILLAFLAPPVAWEVARAALATTARPVARLAWMVLLGGAAAGLGAGVWAAGASHLPPLAPVTTTFGLGLLVAVGWAAAGGLLARGRGRGLPPALTALVALVVIVVLVGPWYVGVHDELLGRLAHESDMYSGRGASGLPAAQVVLSSLGDLTPALSVALGPALLFSLRRPASLARALVLCAGAVGGMVLVMAVLPPDDRYLLPAAPLLAAAAATALSAAPRRLGLAIGGVVLAMQLALSLPWSPAALSEGPGGLGDARRLTPPLPPFPIGRFPTPDPLPASSADQLVEGLWQSGARNGRRVVVIEGPGQLAQGRAIAVLAGFAGYPMHVQDSHWQPGGGAALSGALVVAGACGAEVQPEPLQRLPTNDPRCDIAIFDGEAPPPPIGAR